MPPSTSLALCLLLLVPTLSMAAKPARPPGNPTVVPTRPTVVVTLVVDQLAGWVAAERFEALPATGGLARLRREGIWIRELEYAHANTETAPGHAKVAGLYVICGIEKDRALKAGFDDALMLDWQGRIAETTGANIFVVIDGRLVTPTPHNFLDGITRRAVMGMARTRGWTVEERDVMPEELAQASEVFLCGSAAEIVPVGSIDQHHFQAGPVAKTLMADFQKLVRAPDSEGFGEATHLMTPASSLAA